MLSPNSDRYINSRSSLNHPYLETLCLCELLNSVFSFSSLPWSDIQPMHMTRFACFHKDHLHPFLRNIQPAASCGSCGLVVFPDYFDCRIESKSGCGHTLTVMVGRTFIVDESIVISFAVRESDFMDIFGRVIDPPGRIGWEGQL